MHIKFSRLVPSLGYFTIHQPLTRCVAKHRKLSQTMSNQKSVYHSIDDGSPGFITEYAVPDAAPGSY